jgi:DNA polymerase III, alpha subunit
MFLPLRVHSAFSRGRGGAALDELARAFARDRLPAGALTDIENLYGWPQWKRAAAGAGFSPLFGCEIEIGGRTFLFLVQNRDGYGNLMEILNRRRIREGDGTVGLATVWIPGTGEGRKPERKNVSSDAGRKTSPGATVRRLSRWTSRRCFHRCGPARRRPTSMSGWISSTRPRPGPRPRSTAFRSSGPVR